MQRLYTHLPNLQKRGTLSTSTCVDFKTRNQQNQKALTLYEEFSRLHKSQCPSESCFSQDYHNVYMLSDIVVLSYRKFIYIVKQTN